MKEIFTLLLGMVILIVCEIWLIYIACTATTNRSGKFKYEDTYMCVRDEINYTIHNGDTTAFTDTATSATTDPPITTTILSSKSTTSSPRFGTTIFTNGTSTTTLSTWKSEKSSTYSEIPSAITDTPIQSTTPKWTSSTRGSTSPGPKTTASATTLETTSSVTTSFMSTTMTFATTVFDTSIASSASTSTRVPWEVTVESTSTKESTTITTVSSQTSSSDAIGTSSMDISSTVPRRSSTASSAETTNTVTGGATEMTTDAADTSNCSEFIVTDFNYVLRRTVTNVACILIKMKMWISLQYTTQDFQIGKTTLAVPMKARTAGDCAEKTAEMILRWSESAESRATDTENRIVLRYVHDDVTFSLDSVLVDVHLDGRNFPRARQERISGYAAGLQLFHAPVKDGVFTCTMDTAIKMENQIIAVISDMRLIAFNNCSKSCWKTENNCITKTTVNAIIGTIVIGASLIFITLILVLMWHKRRNNFASFKIIDYSLPRKTIIEKKWVHKHHRECWQ